MHIGWHGRWMVVTARRWTSGGLLADNRTFLAIVCKVSEVRPPCHHATGSEPGWLLFPLWDLPLHTHVFTVVRVSPASAIGDVMVADRAVHQCGWRPRL